MDADNLNLIVENISSFNKKKVRKLQLQKPPPIEDLKDTFYLNKKKRNTLNQNSKDMCLIF